MNKTIKGCDGGLPNEIGFRNFYDQFTRDMEEEIAAVFIGAGFSIPGGYSSWKTLLQPIAEELGLDINRESDLISLAQYKVNKDRVRSGITRLLVEEFSRNARITVNHELLASFPIHTIWTTNYDQLIEEAYRKAHKRLDVKVKTEHLTNSKPGRDAVLYKMHGDMDDAHETVLTREDYENFHLKRSLFTEMLKGDLVSKTFLFLGFSFTDPNIDYILSRIRPLLGQEVRRHYCIMRRPLKRINKGADKAEYEYECRKLDLRIEDLKRYGIQTLLIDDFQQITLILQELKKRIRARNIFVSGSAHEFSPLGRDRVERLARLLGSEIIKQKYNLTSGFGLGIGGVVVVGAMEELYKDIEGKTSDRIFMRPFPQVSPQGVSRAELWTHYRQEMIANVGFTVFLCGNKWNEATQTVVSANGMREEYEITISQGKFPIPVGATGWVARDIWQAVTKSPGIFFPGMDIQNELEVLGNEKSTDEEILGAIFSLIHKASGK